MGIFFGFAVPGIVRCMGWIFLLGPHSVLNRVFGTSLDIESLWGMILVETLFWIPISFLLFRGPVLATNIELEDAGRVAGAAGRQVTFKSCCRCCARQRFRSPARCSSVRSRASRSRCSSASPRGISTSSINLRGHPHRRHPELRHASAYGVLLLVFLSGLLFPTSGRPGSPRSSRPWAPGLPPAEQAGARLEQGDRHPLVTVFVVLEVAPIVFTVLSSFTLLGNGTSGWTTLNYHAEDRSRRPRR